MQTVINSGAKHIGPRQWREKWAVNGEGKWKAHASKSQFRFWIRKTQHNDRANPRYSTMKLSRVDAYPEADVELPNIEWDKEQNAQRVTHLPSWQPIASAKSRTAGEHQASFECESCRSVPPNLEGHLPQKIQTKVQRNKRGNQQTEAFSSQLNHWSGASCSSNIAFSGVQQEARLAIEARSVVQTYGAISGAAFDVIQGGGRRSSKCRAINTPR